MISTFNTDYVMVKKALILLGFLDGNVEFTPYLHLWKIESVFKTYGFFTKTILTVTLKAV